MKFYNRKLRTYQMGKKSVSEVRTICVMVIKFLNLKCCNWQVKYQQTYACMPRIVAGTAVFTLGITFLLRMAPVWSLFLCTGDPTVSQWTISISSYPILIKSKRKCIRPRCDYLELRSKLVFRALSKMRYEKELERLKITHGNIHLLTFFFKFA
jgi:hypothetical protein